MVAVLNEADKYFSSWTFWDSNIVWDHETMQLRTDIAKLLARPYPQATAGTPIKVLAEHTALSQKIDPVKTISNETHDLIFVKPLFFSYHMIGRPRDLNMNTVWKNWTAVNSQMIPRAKPTLR